MFNQVPYLMANPMYGSAPIMQGLAGDASSGLLAATGKGTSLLSRLNWSSLLTNAQKTLNVVNQAIPLYYQVKPVFNNIKTLGRIGREFTRMGNASNADTNNNSSTNSLDSTNLNSNENINNNVPEPTFFL